MKQVSRRKLIVGASAGVAITALAGVPVYEAVISHTNQLTANPAGPVMAYVTDAAAGEVVLLVGSKKLALHDPDLVSRLVKAAQ